MILKALYDYYHRSGKLPPMGFATVNICFVIVIDEDGNFVRIDDVRDGKNLKQYVLPSPVTRTVGISPNLLWDNLEYVLALPKEDGEALQAKANNKNASFVERCKSIAQAFPECKEFAAVVKFYDNNGIETVKSADNWDVVLKERTRNVTFQLQQSLKTIAEHPSVAQYLNPSQEAEGDQICLVTGERCSPVRLTGSTPIAGAQATASLVAFQQKSGYDSYGKVQCYNAPLSPDAKAAYVAALKYLTAKDSRNKFSLGNRTFVFWSSSNEAAAQELEACFFSFLSNSKEDDPNANIEKLKKNLKSIWSGLAPSTDEDRFYILGMAPNAARIAVVYWNELSLKEFSGLLLRHFEDMEIADGRKEKKPYMGIYSMLSAVTLGGKPSDVQPNLPEAVLKSVVGGYAYPFPLYASCLRRIRAELSETTCFSITRMAIIKAYINRLPNNNNKLSVMLDTSNTNVGYLCGRLFAVLEKIQEDANNMHTIRERYMSAASATPATVFATLLNLSSHHSEKLKEGSQIWFEKLKGEIVAALPANGFPTHLDLQDQGRFFVGYYHQRQDLYTKKTDNNE